MKTFHTNKKVSKVAPNGQKYYMPVENYIEAKNNDGKCELNEATFSSEFASKLLNIYFKEGETVVDSFGGTGTTMIACEMNGINGINIELSTNQTEYAKNRLEEYQKSIGNTLDYLI